MKKIVYATALVLSIIIIASSFFFNESSKINNTLQNDANKENVIPVESISPLGNLTKYNITISCPLPSQLEKAPVLQITYVPIDAELIRQIGKEVFGMQETTEPVEMHIMDGIKLQEKGKTIEFFGKNRIHYYTEGITPIVKEYDEQEIENVASKLVENITRYWTFDTDVQLELKTIKPCWITLINDPNTNATDEIIHAIGAFYSLRVDDIELYGPGADFTIWVANNRIVNAELHYPMIKTIGYQNITRTPSEAIDNFIKGKTDMRKLGFEELVPRTPQEGKCDIKNVQLVYYIEFSGKTQKQVHLVYKIDATLTYIDIEEGELVEMDYSDYQLAAS